MKQCFGWVLRVLTTLSVLLFLALGVSWWLSFQFEHYVKMRAPRHTRSLHLHATSGRIWIRLDWGPYRDDKGFEALVGTFPHYPWNTEKQFLGVALEPWEHTGPYERDYGVPHAYFMALATILPAAWWWRRRRRAQQVRQGMCLHCGYDLRATPDPAGPRLPRCPECGQVPAPPAKGGPLRRRWQQVPPNVRRMLACVIVMVFAAGSWQLWYWRIEPAIAIRATASIDYNTSHISFQHPPTKAALRYVARLPGRWEISLSGYNDSKLPEPDLFQHADLNNVELLWLYHGTSVRFWIREICRPGSSLTGVTRLALSGQDWQPAELEELALHGATLTNLKILVFYEMGPIDAQHMRALCRPDSGLAAVESLLIATRTPLTDGALREMAARGSGFRSLKRLGLLNSKITDAGLAELAQPGALPALAEVTILGSTLSSEALAALQKARPNLLIKR